MAEGWGNWLKDRCIMRSGTLLDDAELALPRMCCLAECCIAQFVHYGLTANLMLPSKIVLRGMIGESGSECDG